MNEVPNDALSAERKQVTVLFADVEGSMDLAEQHDPEEWRNIMQRFFSILSGAVEEFEGTVDKFTGDGIMAVFGAPVAHEDHPRRACYAALRMLEDVSGYAAELRRAEGLNFSVRVGINSGEVIAGAIGQSESGYTAVGHTVGLAQRMEALAEPGRAYLTESTAALAEGFLEVEDLGEFEIKGASRPVRVSRLEGVGEARSRLDLSRARGFSRFVGRDDEMKTFEDALAEARDGDGRAIAVVAEAGIGKSRLCLEFAERCREEGLEVFEAQAQSHGRSIPYMPVLQMLRAYFGIGDREQERTAREKIAGRALLLDPDFAEDLPVLFDFLGVPDPERPVPALSADARKRALGRILGRLLHAPNRRHTVVILVEDLHWIDEASDEMLGMLIGSIEATNTLVLVNFRPEYSPPWAGDGAYREIPLEPLSEAATAELLADLAGDDPSLDGLEGLIHTRTQGNPFFIEEIVRELVESAYLEGQRGAYRLARPVEDAGVPPTVQAILSSRIDRLSPEGKRLLQVASVLGKEVEHRALQIASGLDGEGMEPAICELTDNGFLYEAEIYPERVFAFRHPLTREVAYGSQLAEGRGATHVAAARALIELEADRHDELAALIADHLAEGGEGLEAARWYARAAYWTGGSQPAEALRLWKQVTRLASELEATGADTDGEAEAMGVGSRLLQLDYAWRLGMDPEEERQLAAEAEEVAQRTGDLRSLALLKMATEARPGLMHDTSTWIAAADEATRLAVESGDQHLEVAIRSAGAYARLCAGRFDDFDRELDRVLEVSGGDPKIGAGIVIGNPVAWAYMGKGTILRERGEYEEAERLLDSAIRVTAEADDPETESWIRGAQTMLRCMHEDVDGALAVARRNCELTERLGDVFSRSLAIASLAIAEIYAGEFAAALKSIDEAERLYRSAMGNGGEQETWRAATRTEALVGVGRVEEAIELAEWAAVEGSRRGLLWSMPVVLLALGRARIANGEDEAAREAFEAAAAVAAETTARVSERSAAEALEALGAGAR